MAGEYVFNLMGVTKHHEKKVILEDVNLAFFHGAHIGIIGANGAGKSSLLKILAGVDTEFMGECLRAKVKIGYLEQEPKLDPEKTVGACVNEGVAEARALLERYDDLCCNLDDPKAAAEMERVQEIIDANDLWNLDHHVEMAMEALRLPPADAPVAPLSGGEKRRVAMCRLLLSNPDVLLLDEPTNHLDLRATEWLEEYLLQFRGTVLVISHDRYFLDRVVQRCIDFTTGKAEFYSGNYSFYVVERQRRFDEKLKQYEKDQAKLQQLTEAAAKLHLWAFMGNDKLHKRAFSIEKRIEKLETTEKPTADRRLNVRFSEHEFRGDEVLVLDGLSKAYGGRTLFHDLSLTVTGGERIALIGDNGTGKTTFLKLVMNEETPDAGWVRRGPAVRTAYLPQIIRFAVPERSMLDTMLYECKCTPQQARDRLGAYGFRGEDVLKPVSALSGGELSRLRLCMLMGGEINFLILDEPTNHLDIASREWIEDALSDYSEALLFVSHDRYFIEKFATRIWALSDGAITDFRGTLEEYHAFRARQTALQQAIKHNERKKEPKPKKKGGASPEKQLAKAEREIEKAEAQMTALEQECETYATDYQKLMELEEQKTALSEQLDALYAAWEALSE